MDCLICHDTTGTYKKFPTDCGEPVYEDKKFGGKTFKSVDLAHVARHVGLPDRENCGACHFYGGGGNNVKHGDLDSSLVNPARSLDIHMDESGLNFRCTDCHRTDRHKITGRRYTRRSPGKPELALPRDDGNRLKCESCHSASPHTKTPKLNDHTDKVACQTCHIPVFARSNPTKVQWDWSRAGVFTDSGGYLVEKDEAGSITYHTKKGEMAWEKNLIPNYFWYNGTMSYVRPGEEVDPGQPIPLNRPLGNPTDNASRIFPFKVHQGKQPYDPVNRIIIVPKLFGPKGSGAYWQDFDWQKSAAAGMAAAGLDFSGEVNFVSTATYWPLSHMIPPAEQALECETCHRKNGRLAGLNSFYMPGRDVSVQLDRLGWLSVLLAAAFVSLHGLLRFWLSKKRK